MPERNERLFWLYAQHVAPPVASKVDAANQQLVQSWSDSGLKAVASVSAPGPSDRLWLFRLESRDPRLATKFNKLLQDHIAGLPATVGVPALRAKRQVNLPTPLVCPRLGPWPKTDIGLHVVNDPYNAMLVTFTYHEGRYYNVPHLQLVTIDTIAANVRSAWQSVACECHSATPGCCGSGCYDCFQLGCSNCDGTGWKDFSRWMSGGGRVDYSSGFPMAVI